MIEATDEMIDAACAAVPDLYRVDAARAIEAALEAEAELEEMRQHGNTDDVVEAAAHLERVRHKATADEWVTKAEWLADNLAQQAFNRADTGPARAALLAHLGTRPTSPDAKSRTD